MKKLIIVLVLLLAATALFGQTIKLGTAFPSGKYLDAPKGEMEYEAVWEFIPTGIRIWDTSGNLQWDFDGKSVQDFKASLDGSNIVVTFSCPDAGRTYTFTANPSAASTVTMKIERPGLPDYTVKMPKQ